jgi:hypothetical protein
VGLAANASAVRKRALSRTPTARVMALIDVAGLSSLVAML